MKNASALTTVLFLAFISFGSCKKDKLDPVCDGSTPTYDAGIKTIINGSCMGSNCHGAGSNNGDLTSYADMVLYLLDGTFEREVLTDQSMPRGGSLSQDEINLIQCWVDNDYPEK